MTVYDTFIHIELHFNHQLTFIKKKHVHVISDESELCEWGPSNAQPGSFNALLSSGVYGLVRYTSCTGTQHGSQCEQGWSLIQITLYY